METFSGCNVNIHAFWSTKNTEAIITREMQQMLVPQITKILPQLGCRALAIKALPDHIHLLFWLNPDQSVYVVVKSVKKLTTAYINENKMCSKKFAWSEKVYSHAVPDKKIPEVSASIRLQKGNHVNMTFEEEVAKHLQNVERLMRLTNEKSFTKQ
jgi:REP element-mobilizing transposase RayT